MERVIQTYEKIIKPEWAFEIAEILFTKDSKGPSFIMAKLLRDGHERLYDKGHPISAGLHMTLVNFAHTPEGNMDKIIAQLNKALRGKMIKIALKNGVADLEFGASGSSERIRAGQKSGF